jgi:hypothetical protein
MIKLLTLTALLFSAHTAFAGKDSGIVYICSNASNEIKLTADLSDKKTERVAVVFVEGIKQVYNEYQGKKQKNVFSLGAIKNLTLQIQKDAKSSPAVILETDPETSHSQTAHSGEGVTVTKFDAALSIPSLKVAKEPVSCLETKWND